LTICPRIKEKRTPAVERPTAGDLLDKYEKKQYTEYKQQDDSVRRLAPLGEIMR